MASNYKAHESGSHSRVGVALSSALDKALAMQRESIAKHVERVRRARPGDPPSEIIRRFERQYLAAVTASGAGVGGAAAAPGVGTGVALALSIGEVGAFLEASTLLTLAIAEVHGLRIDDLERRRTLVLAIVLGDSGSKAAEKVAKRTGQHWARKVVEAVPIEAIRAVNKVLGRNFLTKFGTKEGIVVLGRLVPFGIGAAIGGAANAAFGQTVIRATRRAFGDPPPSWVRERTQHRADSDGPASEA